MIACHDYSAVKASPKNKWTSMQRIILGWLASSYSNPRHEIRKIFNIYFRDELPTTQGLSVGAITSMSLSLKLQEDEKAAIAALQSSSSSTKSVGFEGIVGNLVKQTASDLGIELVEKKHRTLSRATKVMKPRKNIHKKRKAPILDNRMSDDDNSETNYCSDSGGDMIPPTFNKRVCTPGTKRTPQNTGLPSPLSTTTSDLQASSCGHQYADMSETSDSAHGFPSPSPTGVRDMPTPAVNTPIFGGKKLPRLVFRAFSRDSMGINGPQGFGTSFRSPNPPVQAFILQSPSTIGNTDLKFAYSRWIFRGIRSSQHPPTAGS